jgi:hypothetical protein
VPQGTKGPKAGAETVVEAEVVTEGTQVQPAPTPIATANPVAIPAATTVPTAPLPLRPPRPAPTASASLAANAPWLGAGALLGGVLLGGPLGIAAGALAGGWLKKKVG